MPLTQSEFHEELWDATGLTSDDISTTVLNRLLNLSWWEAQDKLRFREKEGEATISTVAGTRAYDVSTVSSDLNSIQTVSVQSSTEDTWSVLTSKDYDTLAAVRDDSTNARAKPEFYSRYESDLILHPVPDAVYTVRVRFLKTLADLISSGFSIPQHWDEVILLGAEARIWRRLGDSQRSALALQQRDAVLSGHSDTHTKENVSDMAAIKLIRARYR